MLKALRSGWFAGVALEVLLFASASAWAHSKVPVAFYVSYSDGTPAKDALISVFLVGGDAEQSVGTDHIGRAALALSPGRYELKTGDVYNATTRQFVVAAAGPKPEVILVNLDNAPRVIPVVNPLQTQPTLRHAAIPEDAALAKPAQQPNPPAHLSTMPLHPTQQAAATATNQPAGAFLTITAGPGERSVSTPATLRDFPHQTVTVFSRHRKMSETYSGVPLIDLLARLGVPHGKGVMGKVLADYIVATGSDGYKTVVSLGELEPDFHPGAVIVADTLDGKALGAKSGPFRLVVSQDRNMARSVYNVVSIQLRSAYDK